MDVRSIARQVTQAITARTGNPRGGTTPGGDTAPAAATPTPPKRNDGVVLTLSPEARAILQKQERTAVLLGSPDTFAKMAPKPGARLNVRT